MTKEEILEKGRQSGEGVYDEREQEIVNRSYGIAPAGTPGTAFPTLKFLTLPPTGGIKKGERHTGRSLR